MSAWVLDLALFVVTLAAVGGGVRMVRGPSTLDRLVAFDTITVCVVAFLVLLSWRDRTTDYLELVLVVGGVGFLTTVVFFFLVQREPSAGEDFADGGKKGGGR